MVLKIHLSPSASPPPEAWPSCSLQNSKGGRTALVRAKLGSRWRRTTGGQHRQPLSFYFNSPIRFVGAGFIPGLLRFPPLVSVYQFGQIGSLFGVPHNVLVFQQLFGSWPLWKTESAVTDLTAFNEQQPPPPTYKVRLLVQTGLYELFQRFTVASLQGWWVVLWDEE